ncbi:acyl-CoA dehydrogenase family protein [Rhodococcus sp. NPDC127530]|uniref:acyl-CoA dehydrogenase family protein n=1 Tax=unclassified Rhodococcus (in: high G+C Gram-positive bacteria) TaxID=192944 RepID=UPI00362F2C45
MVNDLTNSIRAAVHALIEATPEGVTTEELVDFGFADLLEEDPQLAVSGFFEEAGRMAAATAGLGILAHWTTSDTVAENPALTLALTQGLYGVVLGPRETGTRFLAVDVESRRGWLFDAPESLGRRVNGIAPANGLVEVAIPNADPETTLSSDVARRVVDNLLRAVAYQLVGLGTRMLEISIEHVSNRIQFGRAIGVNQTVQHRLADVHVALEGTRAALEATWEDDGSLLIAVAHSRANEAADLAVRHSLQVCGGMGFTEDFALAPLVRQTLLLSGLFDATNHVGRELRAHLTSAGRVPRLGQMSKIRTA